MYADKSSYPISIRVVDNSEASKYVSLFILDPGDFVSGDSMTRFLCRSVDITDVEDLSQSDRRIRTCLTGIRITQTYEVGRDLPVLVIITVLYRIRQVTPRSKCPSAEKYCISKQEGN